MYRVNNTVEHALVTVIEELGRSNVELIGGDWSREFYIPLPPAVQ